MLIIKGCYSHSNSTLSEQRRRWSINEGCKYLSAFIGNFGRLICLASPDEQLRAIVPLCDNGRGSSPFPKAAVLARAATYIGDLTVYISQLKDGRRTSKTAIPAVS